MAPLFTSCIFLKTEAHINPSLEGGGALCATEGVKVTIHVLLHWSSLVAAGGSLDLTLPQCFR